MIRQRLLKTLFLLCTMLALSSCLQVVKNEKITNLRCEYLIDPIGIDNPVPRFTWNHVSPDSGQLQQKAYQLFIATSPEKIDEEADVWNSGLVKSSSTKAVYQGSVPLKPHQTYYWKVKTLMSGNDTDFVFTSSGTASFKMAKLSKNDWQAQWITDEHDKEFKEAPLFRKEFATDRKIKKAYAYVSGLGYYELYINGQRIGKNYLDPGYTQFDKRVLYVTHDVTEAVRKGKNVVAAVLGNGWFNVQSRGVWDFEKATWRKRPQLLCEIRLEYADGSVETIASDNTWKTATGGYAFNNIYSGDCYDAQKEKTGWNMPKYDDSDWKPATPTTLTAPILQAQIMPAIRIDREIKPVSCKALSDRIYVFDLGENIAGLSRLQVKGKKGTELRIRHGELLKENGRLEPGNINIYFRPVDPDEQLQEDRYILKGKG